MKTFKRQPKPKEQGVYNPIIKGEHLGGGFATAPEDCPRITEIDGIRAVDTVICIHYCRQGDCPTWLALNKNRQKSRSRVPVW